MESTQSWQHNAYACVYVLGAGASRFAGYPLSLDLWPFVRDTTYHLQAVRT